MLHGAGGDSEHGLSFLQEFADESNLILVAPESRRNTWDVIVNKYGPDVAFIDRALGKTFEQYSVDATRVAIGGFSDGASYALSLGPMNGKLFTHIIAFSPGFMLPKSQEGTPRVFISHGKRDTVLPIDRCSRSIVPRLEREGYDFVYHEFNGPHVVPHEIAREAVDWFVRM
jgi:predicted esterase